MAEGNDKAPSSSGLDPKLAGLLCYGFGWVSGLIFFLMVKDDDYVRFHAMQSILVFGTLNVLSYVSWSVPVVGWIVGISIFPVSVILWIILMVKAYQGERYKLPFFGDLAENYI